MCHIFVSLKEKRKECSFLIIEVTKSISYEKAMCSKIKCVQIKL